jgi:hypothetical protein
MSTNYTHPIPGRPYRPGRVSPRSGPLLFRIIAELTRVRPFLQALLGGAAIIGSILAGTWIYMSTKQARKASREPGERGSLPSC